VFSAFKDKDFNTLARMISSLAVKIFLCPLPGPRAAGLSQLRQAFAGSGIPVRSFASPGEALAHALRDTPRDGVVVGTGSLALVGEILRSLNQRELQHV
jgi:folylpolyglutamate synthase/dihydropteroate synthase